MWLANDNNVVAIWLAPYSSVCKIPRIFERVSPSNFQTQGSFISIKRRTTLERDPRDVLSSDSVAKFATQNPGFSETVMGYCNNYQCCCVLC